MEERLETNEIEKKSPSLWGILWSPSEHFARIKEKPKIWGPLLMIILVFSIGMIIVTTNTESGTEDLPEELAPFLVIGSIIAGVIVPIVTAFIGTLVYLLIARLARSNVSFRQLFSMNVYLLIITALGMIVNGIGMVITGSSTTTFTSLTTLIPADGALKAVFDNIEVFSIWSVILSAIGLQNVASFSKELAWGVSIGFYMLSIFFSMIGWS
ncbi:Yip1 family protein [Caldifermentibacillus hisashii]|uniref:Yip1 family protein n=1 Tax=Caldifermentibacillus hisashii TaxID=996558 RepID=UPI0037C07FF3